MNPLSIIIPSKTDANLGACVRAIRAAGETATVIVVDDFDGPTRFDPVERAMSWHVQYDRLAQTKQWVRDPQTLREWSRAKDTTTCNSAA